MRFPFSLVRSSSSVALVALAVVLGSNRMARADAPSSQYSIPESKSAVVVDRKTKLIWERSPQTDLRSFADAQAYCASLQLEGATGWRLPTMRELMTIVDVRARNPAIDRKAFPSTAYAEPYWTSTVYGDTSGCKNKSCTWLVDFGSGSAGPTSSTYNQGRVRCVRK